MSEDETTTLVQQHLLLFISLACVDRADSMLTKYPLLKLLTEHGQEHVCNVYLGLALVACKRMDPSDMMVSEGTVSLQAVIEKRNLLGETLDIMTPGEAAEHESAKPVIDAVEFIGHVAADDDDRSYDIAQRVLTLEDAHLKEDGRPCLCYMLDFTHALAGAAAEAVTA